MEDIVEKDDLDPKQHDRREGAHTDNHDRGRLEALEHAWPRQQRSHKRDE